MDIERLEKHVVKAKSKHPVFCSRICHKNPKTIKQRLDSYRRLCELHGTAEYILLEEIYEAFEAYMNGDIEHSVDEWYDVLAVIERIIERLKDDCS